MQYEIAVIALASLIGIAIVSASLLKGWHGWLTYKQRELDAGRAVGLPRCENRAEGRGALLAEHGESGARIEIADLKERIRKLEAIASGVDL
jgi:hypothetical protein